MCQSRGFILARRCHILKREPFPGKLRAVAPRNLSLIVWARPWHFWPSGKFWTPAPISVSYTFFFSFPKLWLFFFNSSSFEIYTYCYFIYTLQEWYAWGCKENHWKKSWRTLGWIRVAVLCAMMVLAKQFWNEELWKLFRDTYCSWQCFLAIFRYSWTSNDSISPSSLSAGCAFGGMHLSVHATLSLTLCPCSGSAASLVYSGHQSVSF